MKLNTICLNKGVSVHHTIQHSHRTIEIVEFRIRGGLILVGTRTYTIQGGLRGREQESHSSSQRFGHRTPLYLSLTSVPQFFFVSEWAAQ